MSKSQNMNACLGICLLTPLTTIVSANEGTSYVSEVVWVSSAVKESKPTLVVNSMGTIKIPYSYSQINLDALNVFQVSLRGLDDDISIKVSKPNYMANDNFNVKWNGIELSDNISHLLDEGPTNIEITSTLIERAANVKTPKKPHRIDELTLKFTVEWN